MNEHNSNYDIRNIRTDLGRVTSESSPLNQDQVTEKKALLEDKSKPEIPALPSFDLKYSAIAEDSKTLIEKTIQVSAPITELKDNADLEAWVRGGKAHHEHKRDTCAFCGNNLPAILWEKLNKHFSEEYERLIVGLDGAIKEVDAESKRIPNLLKIKPSDFYSRFSQEAEKEANKFSKASKNYLANLDSIKKQLEQRKKEPLTPILFDKPISVENTLNEVRESYKKLIDLIEDSNNLTKKLGDEQGAARKALRLHEVFAYQESIGYEDEREAIDDLKKKMEKAEEAKEKAETKENEKRDEIKKLEGELGDEGTGAKRVNFYLETFFRCKFLSLKVIKNPSEDMPTGSQFEVIRNDKKANNLSEGEGNLIAFCYFMATLEKTNTKDNPPIIWIDDPVSSLDSNHIFSIYSLIEYTFFPNEKSEQRVCCEQLFISTHNLIFLKYLTRLPNKKEKKESPNEKEKKDKKAYFLIERWGEKKESPNEKEKKAYFLIERWGDSSAIKKMPPHLKSGTEFTYLFAQLYKCSKR